MYVLNVSYWALSPTHILLYKSGLHAHMFLKHLWIRKFLYYKRILSLVSLWLFSSLLLNFCCCKPTRSFRLYFNRFIKVLLNLGVNIAMSFRYYITYLPVLLARLGCLIVKFYAFSLCHFSCNCSCVLLWAAKQFRHFAAMRLEDFMKFFTHCNIWNEVPYIYIIYIYIQIYKCTNTQKMPHKETSD